MIDPPRYAYTKDDLSVYERIDPHAFEDYDNRDSTTLKVTEYDQRNWRGWRDEGRDAP